MALPGKNKVSIKEVYNYLMTKPKMTKIKALGIIANIQAESAFYSDAVEMSKKVKDKDKGLGLFQHTFPSRKKAFLEQVPDWETNWKGQIDFALEEDEAQNYLNSNYKDKANATEAFMKEFENPQDQSSKAIQDRIDTLNVISFDEDTDEIIVAQKALTEEEETQKKEKEGYYPVAGEEPIDESTLLPEVEIKADSKKTEEVKYRKNVIDRISRRKEYLKFLEDNQDLYKELSSLEKNISLLDKGSRDYNESVKRKNKLISELTKKESILKEQLYKKELGNYVAAENNAREELSRLQNEARAYIKAKEDVPQDIKNQIEKARQDIQANGNRVKLLTNQDWREYDISPVQQGYNQNILLSDGTIDIEESKKTPVLPNPLSDDEKDIVYNIVDENTDQSQITEPLTTEQVSEEEVVTENIVEEVVEDPIESQTQLTNLQKAGKVGESLLKGAGAVLDAVGGPGAIVSYIMGKKGLKAAMKEVQPQASAELSPVFMQHLRQTRELAKKGFHPDQARKFRKELDKSYQIGLENAVRGSGGQRARFLAQSGVLDAQRSSALLDFAAKDEELQTANQEKYEKMMLFKENFDIQRTEKERAEDMARQIADKKAAAGFTAAAFTNLLSGLGNTSLVPNPTLGTTNLYNPWAEKTTK